MTRNWSSSATFRANCRGYAAALRDQGMEPFNDTETGATHVDRELVSGDSPRAANAIGKIAAPMMVAAWAKRRAADGGGVGQAGIVESHRGTSEDLDTAAVVKLQPIDRGNHERAKQRAADGDGVGQAA